MTGLTLGMVLVAAFFHASWNMLVKRVGGGAALIWLCSACATALLVPVVVVFCLVRRPVFGATETLFTFVSGIINLAYFLALQRGYREGDLSVVYPLARGTGPAIAVLASTVVFAERPTPVAWVGIALVLGGVLGLAWGGHRDRAVPARTSIGYALLTGGFVAGYTIWDKASVSTIGVAPLLLFFGAMTTKVVLLAPLARRDWSEVRRHWSEDRSSVLAISVLLTVSYVLILITFATSPVSYVAPAREISILFGTLMGAKLLGEGGLARRLAAAALVVCGVVLLAIG